MNLIFKTRYLHNLSNDEFLNLISTGISDSKGDLIDVMPDMIDLSSTYKGKYDAIDVMAITQATGSVMSSWSSHSRFDAFLLMCIIEQHALHFYEEDKKYYLNEWGLIPFDEYNDQSVSDLINNIQKEAQKLKEFAKTSFDVCQKAIVAQAINGSLDSDFGNLNFKTLMIYGTNTTKTYKSDKGNLLFSFDSSTSQWVCNEHFELPPSFDGSPLNDKPDDSFELDDGSMIKISCFSEVL